MNTNLSLEDIERQFRAGIHIPEHAQNPALFFCPVGLVGAGKTTVTKPIAKLFDLVRISSDELRELLKTHGHDYSSVKTIIPATIADYAQKGFGIAFDMDCGNKETARNIRAAAVQVHAKTFWVQLATPEEFIFEKFRKHPPSWLADNPETMIENYRAQKQKREKENMHFDFDYTFDTSRTDINQQIEACAEKIRLVLNQ